jgi:hypothetical protein
MSTADVMKLYRTTLKNVTVHGILDPIFPAARSAWNRLREQYPLDGRIARASVSDAFVDHAATVYEEVAAANMSASEQELWECLASRLFNPAHVSIKRAEYENAQQGARESINEIGHRIRQLAGCLPEPTPDAVMCSRFTRGVNRSLRRDAILIDRDNFDDLISSVPKIAVVMPRRETVGEVAEGTMAQHGTTS